jgi:hypothetical protein
MYCVSSGTDYTEVSTSKVVPLKLTATEGGGGGVERARKKK